MSRPKKTKKHLHLHAKRRAVQRYGINFNKEAHKQVLLQIQKNKAKFLFRESMNRTHWEVVVDDKPCHVVYDVKRKAIVTFLPPGETNVTYDVDAGHGKRPGIDEKGVPDAAEESKKQPDSGSRIRGREASSGN